ncbi:MAG: cytochrome c [Hoeflea sp.]|uniref:c-type cytochrome n=1 Tax=Hoeflea sp. TaxID=1940281 RepID=UPI001E18EBDA|nr:cytochrome c [Hoeflea sp.]MBU4527289.1 cytochrome c [Alphaproteobacteria bacterium]MBU4546928.1 cytochrome c [Alphaproteobacteria bacterium]MBU4551560.1 cytochrome c [Alphaproteobacteria bacterium]MBV1725565.1 cytochrome c [Hoeflea sp.]MBV1759613.1 cytochrome c [Hoeflea sp.]
MTQILKRHTVSIPALLASLVLSLSVSIAPAWAQTDEALDQGRQLVETNCGSCHGVGAADASPHQEAPPFRNLTDSFPMDALEEAFADGRIYSGHPDMPEFIATPEQVDAIIAYIAFLQE